MFFSERMKEQEERDLDNLKTVFNPARQYNASTKKKKKMRQSELFLEHPTWNHSPFPLDMSTLFLQLLSFIRYKQEHPMTEKEGQEVRSQATFAFYQRPIESKAPAYRITSVTRFLLYSRSCTLLRKLNLVHLVPQIASVVYPRAWSCIHSSRWSLSGAEPARETTSPRAGFRSSL